MLTAIDLFSGAGGLSLGIEEGGFKVLLANDADPFAARTYRRNLPHTKFVEGDVHDLGGRDIARLTGILPGELDLLIGGPPCQGFSIIGRRVVHDPRNDMFHEFLRLAGELRPKALVVENVPGLATLCHGAILQEINQGFSVLGYSCAFAELLAAQYGVPQMRWRMIIVGFRRDLDVPPRMGFPLPTHGKRGIGELIPNCPIPLEDYRDFVTVRDAIGDMPPVEAGRLTSVYTGPPAVPYQHEMRAGLFSELHNHYAPKLSPQNLARINALKAGQDWRDLPRDLLPESMKRAKRKDHTRRYSRMIWDGIARSIITRFRDPKSGEYIHPEQCRTISVREAARIQSFPDRFAFEGPNTELYNQVGNAVPPRLARAIGGEIKACLEGSATHQLVNPFARRPTFRQGRLPLIDALSVPPAE